MSNILTIVRGDASNIVMVRVRHIWLRRTAGQPSAGGSSVKYDYWEPGVGGDWRENLVVSLSGKILTKTVTNY